ncbi:MAG: hypothetical protein ACOCP4_04630 [Candidatus Woesearchaeota archaeon]
MAKQTIPFGFIPRDLVFEKYYKNRMTKNSYVALAVLSSVCNVSESRNEPNGLKNSWMIPRIKIYSLLKSFNISPSNFYAGIANLEKYGFIARDSHNIYLTEYEKLLDKENSNGYIRVPHSIFKLTNFTHIRLISVRVLLFLLNSGLKKDKYKGVEEFKFEKIKEKCWINRPNDLYKCFNELEFILNVNFTGNKRANISFKSSIRDTKCNFVGKYYTLRAKTYRFFKHDEDDYKTLSILNTQYKFFRTIILSAMKITVNNHKKALKKGRDGIIYFDDYVRKVCNNLYKSYLSPPFDTSNN